MLIQPPAAGFDEPLALLAGCHRRIMHFCNTLERLRAHLEAHGADAEARTAAGRILDYFERAAPLHHADEETDLLPLLRRCCEDEAQAARLGGWAARMEAEHRAQAAAWQALRPALEAVRDGRAAALDPAAPFIALERAHVRFEDQEVFPLAARRLGRAELQALGRAMARRRQAGSGDEAHG